MLVVACGGGATFDYFEDMILVGRERYGAA